MVMKLIRASRESARARRASVAALVVAAALLAGCATNPAPPTGETYDPFEPVNRQIFGFNEKVDEFVLAPAGEVYREVVPSPIRDSVRAFLRHLSTPVILANDVLQGDIEAAGATTARFFLNSMDPMYRFPILFSRHAILVSRHVSFWHSFTKPNINGQSAPVDFFEPSLDFAWF